MSSDAEVTRLRETFDAAADLGLDPQQIWESILEVVDSTPPDRPAVEWVDDLAAALAARIGEEA
jgi:hypothetical protein